MSTSEISDARWQPCRAGIFNVWEYDNQTFEFGDGRLVLRGRNGSGKSNALALLFPFLFDGVMSASRMDPMGGARSMKSLLLGRSDDSGTGRYRHDSGTGYVWMEFERPAERAEHDADPASDQSPTRMTIGIGASATTQRDAESWFFVTPHRIGIDIDVHEADVPKSRRQLAESLVEGHVYTTADDFRTAVDRHLFGLGTTRYRTLVDLLLTLRRPHLAGKLDVEHISSTLSAGLSELDAGLIDDVSHSFDDLDAMQHELDAMTTALDAVERFLPVYREHLLGVARRRSQELLDAHAGHRRVVRDRTAAENERAEADAAAAGHRGAIDGIEQEQEGIEVEIETIQQSPAYQSATALAEVEKAVVTARQHAGQLDDVAETTRARAESDESAATGVEHRHETESGALANRVDEWMAASDALGVDATDVRSAGADFDADAATTAVVQRRIELDTVNEAARAGDRAAEAAANVAELFDKALRAVADARRGADGASSALAEELRVLGVARRDWFNETSRQLGGLVDIANVGDVTMLGSILDHVEEQVDEEFSDKVGSETEADRTDDATDDDRAGEVDVAVSAAKSVDIHARVDRALAAIDAELLRECDRVSAAGDGQRETVDTLTVERERIATEPNPGPPPNPTRPDAPLADMGAPLYACVDFAPGIDAADRAGFEAAFAGAGLLDARILPPGVETDTLDAVLGDHPFHGATTPTLADILVPVPVGALDANSIHAVLATVPLDAEWARLRPDGTWRLGPVSGRYQQPTSVYIGHEARERRRAERLAELDGQLELEQGRLAELDVLVTKIGETRSSVEASRTSQPATADLQERHRELDDACSVERDRRAHAEGFENDAERTALASAQASAERHRLAVLFSTLSGTDELAAMQGELTRWGDRIDGIRLQQATVLDVATRATTARTTASTAREEAADTARRSTDAHRHAELEAERYERLRRNVGADAQQAVVDLGDARARLVLTRSKLVEVTALLRVAETSSARLTERVDQLASREIEAHGQLETAIAGMEPVRSAEVSDVLEVAGADAGVEHQRVARTIIASSDPVAADATNRMEAAYRTIILDGLRAGHDPSMPKLGGFDVIRVATGDGEVTFGKLVERLRADNERLGSLLSTKEREIFETHLLTNVGDSIRQLLLDADHFEQQINAEMSKAPTASGMTVELAWNPIADESGVRDAVNALRYSPDMLSPEQREMLRSFFVDRIDEVRTADPGLSFAEALTAALDYRAWHRFDLFARFSDGKKQRVTRAFFRGLSGGEAATVLHLPLFASAAAQYSSGDIAGPRLIALDEGFVGIDDQMRGRLMGLLTQLDLDVIVTSHEFWGFYEQVPNLVVYDLVRNPSSPGIYAQRFDWTASTT